MIAVGFNSVITVNGGNLEFVSCGGYQILNIRLSTKCFQSNESMSRNDSCRRSLRLQKCVSYALTSFPSSTNQVLCSSQVEFKNSAREGNESVLILIRHGESMWNEKNLFTGCVDVPLTEKGVEEAIEAGKRISDMPIDIVYTSALVRSQMTAMLALTEHRCMKVPIIMHNEDDQARIWSQIYSKDTESQSVPVVEAWQLNERMYGDLQGFNKQKTAEKYGKDQVHKWRRSYDVRPPNGESLEMCLRRAVSFFKEQIEPLLLTGKHVMVVAHANSLRSMIMYLDELTSEEVINLELSTGVPMLYICKEGKFIRRGSPAGSREAGVFAYTESLGLYRQKLAEGLY